MNAEKKVYDDEINLIELLNIVWKRKYIIAVIVFVVCAITVVSVYLEKNIYASRAVLKPSEQTSSMSSLGGLGTLASFAGISTSNGGSVFADINTLLSDKKFIADFVKKNELGNKLVEKPEVLESDDFKRNENYNYYKLIKGNLSLTEDRATKYISVKYTHEDPEFAQKLLSLLLIEISNRLKVNQMENLVKRIDNYKLEIDRATDMTLKIKLSELVANLIQSKVLANADQYYGFGVLNEPSKAEPRDKEGPNRKLICIIAFMTSFIASVFGVLIYEFIRNMFSVKTDKATEGVHHASK
jgi:LPS O-antigen subunit length determinant protein (WzzB/FepE family)